MAIKFGLESYGVQDIQRAYKEDPREIRREYSRLRSIARKRLERLGQSEYAGSTEYRLNRYSFVPLAQIKDAKDLSYRLRDLVRFLSAKGSTVTGQRQIETNRIESLHKSGYDFVNKSNLKEWGNFMEFVRSVYPNKGSGTVSEGMAGFAAYKEIRKGGFPPELMRQKFEDYLARMKPDSVWLSPIWEPVQVEVPEEWR